MKAIRKSDGKEIDVILYHQKEYIEIDEGTKERKLYGRAIYPAEALIVQEPIDWSAFRREAAKDILAGMVANGNVLHGGKYTSIYVGLSIAYADELIEQLKEEQK